MTIFNTTHNVGRVSCSKVASASLLHFNRFKETLEIACTEALVVVSLDYLEEKRGSVFDGFGENLKEVALVVVVYQNFKLLESVNIFCDLDAGVFEALSEAIVIGVGDGKELDSSLSQGSH